MGTLYLVHCHSVIILHGTEFQIPATFFIPGRHSELVKLLILNGAKLDSKNTSNLRPIDLATYRTETWNILHNAKRGDMPELEKWSEVPIIPDFALLATGKKKRKGTGKKKGKKGGKKKKGKKKK